VAMVTLNYTVLYLLPQTTRVHRKEYRTKLKALNHLLVKNQTLRYTIILLFQLLFSPIFPTLTTARRTTHPLPQKTNPYHIQRKKQKTWHIYLTRQPGFWHMRPTYKTHGLQPPQKTSIEATTVPQDHLGGKKR
jgi:hypothetical protein